MPTARWFMRCFSVLVVGTAGCSHLPLASSPEVPPLPEPHASRAAVMSPPPAPAEIMALTPEMGEYLDYYIDPRRRADTRVRALSGLVLHPGMLGVDYDARKTLTAAATFRTRAGNCLSLSILFVVLAREIGIEARFQQVDVSPTWDRRGEIIVTSRHINVTGRLGPSGDYVMDFLPFPERRTVRSRILSDEAAIGQFYNNLGADRLAAGDLAGAWVNLRAAVETAPRLGMAWSNLGVLYRRVDKQQTAERLLRYALRVEPDNTSAMNNLAGLLHGEGRDNEAQALLARLERVREKNPYYFHALARRDIEDGDDRRALAHLRRAIELKADEVLFYRNAAEVAHRLQEPRLAARFLADARRLSTREPETQVGLRF